MTDENEGCFWIVKDDFGTEEMLLRRLTSRRLPPVQWVKVEYEPAETNLDETIEESFEDKIVSQETQASYCLLVFLNQRASSVFL